MSKMLTLILPSLNVADYIEQCVESVILQTIFNDIEVLLVDAGSTDGTLEILKRYEGRYSNVRLILSSQKSYGYQVNLGIREAQGAYVGIVETDDYVRCDMFEVLLKRALDNDLDYIKADYSQFVTLRNGKEAHEVVHMLSSGDSRYGEVIDPTFYDDLYMLDYFLWKGIYKRDFLIQNNIGFEETLGAAFQDIGFTEKVLSFANRAMYLNDVFYRYRTDRPTSSMNSGKALLYSKYEFEHLLSNEGNLPNIRGIYLYLLSSFVGNIRYLIRNDSVLKGEAASAFEWILKTLEDGFCRGIISQTDFSESVFGDYARLRDNPYLFVEELMEDDKKQEAFVTKLSSIMLHHVVIFGAGTYGRKCFLYLDGKGISVEKYIDNSAREGMTMLGIPVIRPSYGCLNDTIVVVANKYSFDEIKQQLLTMGVDNSRILKWPCV